MERPAVPIGPIHHGRDAEFMRLIFHALVGTLVRANGWPRTPRVSPTLQDFSAQDSPWRRGANTFSRDRQAVRVAWTQRRGLWRPEAAAPTPRREIPSHAATRLSNSAACACVRTSSRSNKRFT